MMQPSWAISTPGRSELKHGESLAWLALHLDPENKSWLASLDERLVTDRFTLSHGSPRNPIWEYVMDVSVANANMAAFETDFCLVGHTHIPCVYMVGRRIRSFAVSVFLPAGRTFCLGTKEYHQSRIGGSAAGP